VICLFIINPFKNLKTFQLYQIEFSWYWTITNFNVSFSLVKLLKWTHEELSSSCHLLLMCVLHVVKVKVTLWRPAAFGDFRKKKRLNARGFVQEYLRSCLGYGPGRNVKRRSKSSSLHSKKKFLVGGCGFFVSDIISGGLLGHLGPLCLALGANR